MRTLLFAIMGWIGGYFLGSTIFRVLGWFGVDFSNWPVILLLVPYVMAFGLAFVVTVVDVKRKRETE